MMKVALCLAVAFLAVCSADGAYREETQSDSYIQSPNFEPMDDRRYLRILQSIPQDDDAFLAQDAGDDDAYLESLPQDDDAFLAQDDGDGDSYLESLPEKDAQYMQDDDGDDDNVLVQQEDEEPAKLSELDDSPIAQQTDAPVSAQKRGRRGWRRRSRRWHRGGRRRRRPRRWGGRRRRRGGRWGRWFNRAQPWLGKGLDYYMNRQQPQDASLESLPQDDDAFLDGDDAYLESLPQEDAQYMQDDDDDDGGVNSQSIRQEEDDALSLAQQEDEEPVVVQNFPIIKSDENAPASEQIFGSLAVGVGSKVLKHALKRRNRRRRRRRRRRLRRLRRRQRRLRNRRHRRRRPRQYRTVHRSIRPYRPYRYRWVRRRYRPT